MTHNEYEVKLVGMLTAAAFCIYLAHTGHWGWAIFVFVLAH